MSPIYDVSNLWFTSNLLSNVVIRVFVFSYVEVESNEKLTRFALFISLKMKRKKSSLFSAAGYNGSFIIVLLSFEFTTP